ncbi:MAG: hypothetical protein KDC07_08915 [Chitinophagaceae bacterium]|nr:hypothetical protein [Chitinophagaceae bacterium]MCB9046839.1 hypothetical protein [Chitinophagales bacterium]
MVGIRTCESFNVDNYGLHTRKDIFKKKHAECSYDSQLLTKPSVFILNIGEKELRRSTEYNELKK